MVVSVFQNNSNRNGGRTDDYSKGHIQRPSALNNVKQKFKIWCKTRIRGTRIPEELWQAAKMFTILKI